MARQAIAGDTLTVLRGLLSSSRIVPILLSGLTACLFYNAIETVSRIVQYYTPLPIWDYWRVVEDLPDMQAGHWGFLWRQHNDHRVVFPELVFTADMLWWHGRKFLPLIVTFFCYAGTWMALSIPVMGDRKLVRAAGAFASGVAGCMVLWRSAALVLADPFLLQWTLMQAAMASALVFLTRMPGNKRFGACAGVIGSAIVATYSSGNGLLLWPMLIGLGVLLRLTWKQLLMLSAAGVVTAGCYFIGYKSSGSLNVQMLLGNPGQTLGFVASYLSMPFGGLGSTEGRAGLIAGSMALAITLTCAAICLVRGWIREPAAIILLGFLACNIGTAVMTAGGRMNPADVTFGGAKALRYLSVPQANWGAVILLALWAAGRINLRKVFVPVCCATVWLLAVYLPRLNPWMTTNAEPYSEAQLATISIEDGTMDGVLTFNRVYPDLHVLEVLRARLESAQKSIYYRGRGRWLQQPASRFAPMRPRLPGAVAAAYPSGAGIQVAGWADDSDLRRRYLWVVLTDEGGTIRGFGRRFPAGFPNTASVPSVPPSLAWAGYVPANMAGKKVLAYVVDPRKLGLMPLDGELRIPNVTLEEAGHAGEMFAGVTWTWSTSTGRDESGGGAPSGGVPPGPIHSTYRGSDAATGSIVSSAFARPASGCVIIPIRPGPSVAGLSARLEDSATGATVEELPLRSDRSSWQYWRANADATHPKLRVVLQDDGRGWGQWVAASTPLRCQ